MQLVSLQAFVGNQLFYRDSCLNVPLRVGEVLPSIADYQDIDRLQIGGEVKLPAQNIRLEVAHPHATQTQLCGLEHHVVGQNGSVNIAGLLLVKGPHPRLVVVGADNDCQGRTVDVGGFANLRQSVLALNGDQVNRLEVGGGGGHMSGLQNFFQLLRLYLLVGVAADGAASFCNRNEIHDMLSFLNSLMAYNGGAICNDFSNIQKSTQDCTF